MSGWYDETHTHAQANAYTEGDVEMQRLEYMCNFLAKPLIFIFILFKCKSAETVIEVCNYR